MVVRRGGPTDTPTGRSIGTLSSADRSPGCAMIGGRWPALDSDTRSSDGSKIA